MKKKNLIVLLLKNRRQLVWSIGGRIACLIWAGEVLGWRQREKTEANDAVNTDSSQDKVKKKKTKKKPPPAWPQAHADNVWLRCAANPASNVAGLLFVCWVQTSPLALSPPPSSTLSPFIALYLCPPVWRWCHSWGEAMIKILLSPSQHGPALRRDSVPPVWARRVIAAHSSSCLPSTGGRRVGRALPAKAEILDICLSEEEIKKEQTLPWNPLAFFFLFFFTPSALLLGRFWWRWRTLKHEGCSMWFAPASGSPLTRDRPQHKKNKAYKQGIKPSTRPVY